MGTLLKIYERALKKYPLITSSVQTGLLMASGDVIAQTVVEGTSLQKINFVRTAQFGSIGLCFAGPGLTAWYRILARCFGDNNSKTAVLKKLACDQLVFAPIFIGVFLATLGVVQGRNVDETISDIRRDYQDIVLNNYKLWPWVQLGNFYVVPLRYQVLVVQVVAIFWNTYLSWKTQSSNTHINKQ